MSSKISSMVTTRLAAADGGGQTVEHRGLAGLRGPGDQHVQARTDGDVQVVRRLSGQRPELHQVLKSAGPRDELADVHRPVPAGDVRDDHVQAGTVGQLAVNEGLGKVQAASGGLEHALHQRRDLGLRKPDGGQLGGSSTRSRNLVGSVDPDFLDVGIIQQRLEGAESGDCVHDPAPGQAQFPQRRQHPQQGSFVIVADHLVHQARGPPPPVWRGQARACG